jgi:hypothetical protein
MCDGHDKTTFESSHCSGLPSRKSRAKPYRLLRTDLLPSQWDH